LESELLDLNADERNELLGSLGVEEPSLDRLIHAGYRLLGLETFFTVGENEVRAWTMHEGATAFEAAGEIHSDFQRGFIRADAIAVDAVLQAGSYKVAREQGIVRSEGREYVVRDGDVLLFRFNV
jgi:ribosome-binding ATPase YchF (GTP1/OBG family)